MVIPDNVKAAVNEGDVAAVVAWLDDGGDVNGHINHGGYFDTLLMFIPQAHELTTRHVELARMLLHRGADVNLVPNGHGIAGDGYSALHVCVDFQSYVHLRIHPVLLEIIGIYIAAGANVNSGGVIHADEPRETPLGMALQFRRPYGVEIHEGWAHRNLRPQSYYCEPGRHSMRA
jgi:hypothetical protein